MNVDIEATHQKAKDNLREWNRIYGELRNILQNCTEEEFEQCIQLAIQQGNVKSEDKLREEFLLIRNSTEQM